jgi:hypothetical protein
MQVTKEVTKVKKMGKITYWERQCGWRVARIEKGHTAAEGVGKQAYVI